MVDEARCQARSLNTIHHEFDGITDVVRGREPASLLGELRAEASFPDIGDHGQELIGVHRRPRSPVFQPFGPG